MLAVGGLTSWLVRFQRGQHQFIRELVLLQLLCVAFATAVDQISVALPQCVPRHRPRTRRRDHKPSSLWHHVTPCDRVPLRPAKCVCTMPAAGLRLKIKVADSRWLQKTEPAAYRKRRSNDIVCYRPVYIV